MTKLGFPRLVTLAVAVTLVAAACSSDDASTTTTSLEPQATTTTTTAATTTQPPPEPKVFTMAVAAVQSNVDPAVLEGKPSTELGPMFAGTLLQYVTPASQSSPWPSPSETEPFVAESVSQIDDGYRFVLRDDAVSQYGNTITSADVEWTFDRIVELDGTGRFLLSLGAVDLADPIRIVDERTFDLITTDPNNPYSLAMMTYGSMGPLDSVEIASNSSADDPWGTEFLASNSAGFGPYQLDSITPAEELRLIPNPNWWGPEPDIDTIIIRSIPDSASRLQLLSSGDVDFADKLSLDQFATVSSPLQAIPAKGNTTIPLVLNYNNAPFDDVRVRQAISMAIDRSALVQGPMQGFANEALYQVLSEVPQPPPPGDGATYDPDGARALLADAGVGDGFGFTLTVNPVRPGPFSEDLAVLIKSQLADVGIDVTIEVVASSADFQTALSGRELEAWIGSQTPGISDAQFAWVLVHHSTKAFENAHGYSNARVDELIDLMGTTPYGDARDAQLLEAHQILIDEVPWIPLIELVNPIALGEDVTGFRMDIFRRVIPQELAKR